MFEISLGTTSCGFLPTGATSTGYLRASGVDLELRYKKRRIETYQDHNGGGTGGANDNVGIDIEYEMGTTMAAITTETPAVLTLDEPPRKEVKKNH